MPRFTDSVAPEDQGLGKYTRTTMTNIPTGGHFGYQANIARYVDNAAFRQQQMICIVMETPSGFQFLEDPDMWRGCLKSIMEKHTRTITGFQRQFTNEFFDSVAGGSGAVQHDLSNVTMAQPTPTHEIPEKYGFPIGTFFEWWTRLFLMDPDTKYPLIATYDNAPDDLLPDVISMVCLYIEPDPTHTEVVNAWLVVNMMPRSTGTRESRKDKSQGSQEVVHSIEFTGTAIVNRAVDILAEDLLHQMSIVNANPYNTDLPDVYKTVNADVKAQPDGYAEDIEYAESHQTSN